MKQFSRLLIFAAALVSPALGGDIPYPADRPLTVCFYPPIPERYDYNPPYPVEFIRIPRERILEFCTEAIFYACAFPGQGRVAMLTDEILMADGLRQTEIDCLKRHEIAHLNGWGAGHEP